MDDYFKIYNMQLKSKLILNLGSSHSHNLMYFQLKKHLVAGGSSCMKESFKGASNKTAVFLIGKAL